MGVVGASQFRASATLANTQGISAQPTGLLDNISTSLLDAGRRINRNGFGLSSGARANLKRLQDSAADFNALFSLSGGGSSDVQSAQTQILALRSQTPTDQLARSLVDIDVDGDGAGDASLASEIAVDDGSVADADTGQTVDTEV